MANAPAFNNARMLTLDAGGFTGTMTQDSVNSGMAFLNA